MSSLLQRSDFELENLGRLTHPLVYDLDTDKFRVVEWEDAFARIGEVLRGLSSPNEAEFYTSGRASNEAAYLFQLFAREYALCLYRARQQFDAQDLFKAGKNMLRANLESNWLGAGQYLRAATWLKSVYDLIEETLTPIEVVLKAYYHMPNVPKPDFIEI